VSEPRFVPANLTELMNDGVLMAANERFFWPLGLALSWMYDPDTGEASSLEVRQWEYQDGHREAIEVDENDAVAEDRRIRFAQWIEERASAMPIAAEADRARSVL